MSGCAVLLCSGTGLDLDAVAGAPARVVEELCGHPAAAAAALRELGANHVVLGLCHARPSSDLVAALRRAGAVPFGIETVLLAGREPREAARLVGAARARVEALTPGERGTPVLAAREISRRGLFSTAATVTYEPVAVLDAAACAGTARCGLCIDVCPEHAIDGASALPTVDDRRCSSCGRCVPHCPQGALHLAGSSTAQVEAQLEELLPGVRGVVFACAEAGAVARPGWALVELPTLALLTPGWILQVRLRGAEVRIVACGEACRERADRAESLADRVLAVSEPRPRHGPARIVLGEPLATADSVVRLAPRGSRVLIEDEASPLGLLTFDRARCTLCGACGAACPTSALELDETQDKTVLLHEPTGCVACGRCVTACAEDALAVRRAIDVERLARGSFELFSVVRETCTGCGADLPPRPLRRRLREVLPQIADAPLALCAACALAHGQTAGERSHTMTARRGAQTPDRRILASDERS